MCKARGMLLPYVCLILSLAEQGKSLRKIVKNNYWYKTASVQTVSWKKEQKKQMCAHGGQG